MVVIITTMTKGLIVSSGMGVISQGIMVVNGEGGWEGWGSKQPINKNGLT